MNIVKEILSFPETVALSCESKKTVWLLRHSMRLSLASGTTDPGLTSEGRAYAVECGALLAGIENPFFGASPRIRCLETSEALMEGGNYGRLPLYRYPELRDTAMFTSPDALDKAVAGGNVPTLLAGYFSEGFAPEMVPLGEFSAALMSFLKRVADEHKNVILTTHDIVILSILFKSGVYEFHQNDWCGYIQGALLFQDNEDKWHLAYTVPDRFTRRRYQLFV